MERAIAHSMNADQGDHQQRASKQPAVHPGGLAGLGQHACFGALQDAAQSNHRLAQGGFQRHATRFEVSETPGVGVATRAAIPQVTLDSVEIVRSGLPETVCNSRNFRRGRQRPGGLELHAQGVHEVLRAGIRLRSRHGHLCGDTGVQRERTIQRALHGGHPRQIQTGIRLSPGGAQHTEHGAGH